MSINNGRDARGHRVGRCFTPDDMDYTTYYAIESVFRDLIIAQAEAGSDNGSITLVLEKEINAKIAEVQARLNIPEGKGKRMLMIDEFVKKEEEKKIRKQKLKDIHKEVDPHGEEECED